MRLLARWTFFRRVSHAAALMRAAMQARTGPLAASLCTLLVGVFAGLAAMGLGLLLHAIQHLTYGYGAGEVMGGVSFLQGVEMASPLHRFATLVCAGAVAGGGWYAVYRFGRPLVSVTGAVSGKSMPPASTIAHALLQIVTVAMGSPLGREVAPREAGALLAQQAGKFFGVSAKQMSVLAACGAGAGLAAIYNVPLAGAVFVLEVLVAEVTLPIALQALVACGIATWVARLGLGDETQYHLPVWHVGGALDLWAVLAAPVLGWAALAYRALMARMRARAPRDARLLPCCLLAFAVTGVMAMVYPEIPGNGKGPLQLGLLDQMSPHLAALMLLLKLLATLLCLRAGAEGGLLTPGLTIGGLLSIVLAQMALWCGLGVEAGACACIGAAAFLGVSMRMPLTAMVLMMGLTNLAGGFLMPMALACIGAWMAATCAERGSSWWKHREH